MILTGQRAAPLALAITGLLAFCAGLFASVPKAVAAEPTFFQKLFGISGAPTPPPMQPVQQAAPPRASRTPVTMVPYDGPRSVDSAESGASHATVTRYRTLCVRTCDGFFFPISDKATRRHFYRDSEACFSRCGGEARLFYYPVPGGDSAAMVDLSGRSYSNLPAAFKFRKQQVAGCRCHAEPWDASEVARHQSYAATAAQELAERTRAQEVVPAEVAQMAVKPAMPRVAAASAGALQTVSADAAIFGPPMPTGLVAILGVSMEPPPSPQSPSASKLAVDTPSAQPAVKTTDAKPAGKPRASASSSQSATQTASKQATRIFVSDGKGGWVQMHKAPVGARLIGDRPSPSLAAKVKKWQPAEAPKNPAVPKVSMIDAKADPRNYG